MSSRDKFDQLLDSALSKSPDFELSGGFSDQVVRKIESLKAREERNWVLMQFGLVLAFILISAICLIIFIPQSLFQSISTPMVGWAVLIGILVALIQYFDKLLIKRKTRLIS